MEIWLALFIPVAVVVFCLFKFKRSLVWWELPIPIVATTVLILIFNWIGKSSRTKDIEYWGNHVVSVEYYEDWNEYVHRTCTRSVPCGTDKDGHTQYCTETYDCSYVDYHSEYWQAIDDDGESYRISESNYKEFKSRFGNENFTDMNRDYYTDDGDMYSSNWPETYETYEFIASEHVYKNKVQVSSDVFNYPTVTEEEFKNYQLYDYPEITGFHKLNAVLSHKIKIANEVQKKFDWINGQLGNKKQVRVWVMLFDKGGREYGEMQEAYWKGGNKNELCICIGTDGNEVRWAHVFSWTEVQTLKIEIRNFIQSQEKLDLKALADFLYPEIENKWKRKEFKDFDYIDVELPLWSIIVTLILSLISSVVISFFLVNNEFDQEYLARGNSKYMESGYYSGFENSEKKNYNPFGNPKYEVNKTKFDWIKIQWSKFIKWFHNVVNKLNSKIKYLFKRK